MEADRNPKMFLWNIFAAPKYMWQKKCRNSFWPAPGNGSSPPHLVCDHLRSDLAKKKKKKSRVLIQSRLLGPKLSFEVSLQKHIKLTLIFKTYKAQPKWQPI